MSPAEHPRAQREAVEVSMLLRVEAGYTPALGWRDRRACEGKPTAWWFDQHAPGPEFCRGCPVRMDCLAFIMPIEMALSPEYIVGYTAIPARLRADYVRAHRPPPVTGSGLCGSDSGYHRHRSNGETPCVECKAAHAAKQRDAMARRRAAASDAPTTTAHTEYTALANLVGYGNRIAS